MVARPPEEQLPDNSACKGDGRHILLCGIAGVGFAVEFLEDGVDLANDTADVVRRRN